MQTTIIPTTTPTITDSPLDLGDELGDEILLGAAATNKVATVKRVSRSAPSVRAWTMGGRVD